MVTGLPHDVTAEQLVRDFSAEGEVEHVKASQCGKNKKSFLYIYIYLYIAVDLTYAYFILRRWSCEM